MTEQSVTFEQILDWLDGRLSTEEAQRVQAQLTYADATTQADVDWLQDFHQWRQHIILEAPPPRLRQQLNKRFRQQQTAVSLSGIWQQFKATLMFDSAAQPGLAGTRSAASLSQTRQQVYNTPVADIALNTQPQDERIVLTGQVFLLGEDSNPVMSVQLLQEYDNEIDITLTNDLGEFTFSAFKPGVFALVVSNDQFEVTITPLNLQI